MRCYSYDILLNLIYKIVIEQANNSIFIAE